MRQKIEDIETKLNDAQENINRLEVARKTDGLTCVQEVELIELRRSILL